MRCGKQGVPRDQNVSSQTAIFILLVTLELDFKITVFACRPLGSCHRGAYLPGAGGGASLLSRVPVVAAPPPAMPLAHPESLTFPASFHDSSVHFSTQWFQPQKAHLVQGKSCSGGCVSMSVLGCAPLDL